MKTQIKFDFEDGILRGITVDNEGCPKKLQFGRPELNLPPLTGDRPPTPDVGEMTPESTTKRHRPTNAEMIVKRNEAKLALDNAGLDFEDIEIQFKATLNRWSTAQCERAIKLVAEAQAENAAIPENVNIQHGADPNEEIFENNPPLDVTESWSKNV